MGNVYKNIKEEVHLRTKVVTRKLQEDSRGMVDDVDCDKGGNLDLNTDNTNKELNTDNSNRENEIAYM